MDIGGVGRWTTDPHTELLTSPSVAVDSLGGSSGRFVIDSGILSLENERQFADTVADFTHRDQGALHAASRFAYQYYLDTARLSSEQGRDVDIPEVDDEGAIWRHVTFGREFDLHLGRDGDASVYLSVECECEWETEHGLQIVFRSGREVCKLGPFDGHMTNAEAFGRRDLADRIYVSPFDL